MIGFGIELTALHVVDGGASDGSDLCLLMIVPLIVIRNTSSSSADSSKMAISLTPSTVRWCNPH